MLKGVRRQWIIDQAQMQTVDPMPEEDGKNDLPAKVETEEAGMKLRKIHERHHEATTDNRQRCAKEESFGEIPPFRIPPRQEVMDRESEDDGEDNTIGVVEDTSRNELLDGRAIRGENPTIRAGPVQLWETDCGQEESNDRCHMGRNDAGQDGSSHAVAGDPHSPDRVGTGAGWPPLSCS